MTNALKDLVQDGLLVRQRGRGTFIRQPAKRPVATRLVALVMRASGHSFADLAQFLVNGFQRRGYYPTLFDALPIWEGTGSIEHLEHFVESGAEAIVVEGMSAMPLERLARLKASWKRSVVMLRDEGTAGLPGATRVLSDVRQGVRMAVNHLVARGHRRIAHVSHFLERESPRVSGQMIAEFEAACRAHPGVDGRTLVVDEHEPASFAHLAEVLSRPDSPTAIFSSHDYRAKLVYDVAERVGVRVPDDLELVGFGNTPWCEALPVTLTSIDQHLRTVAEEVVEAALGDAVAGETRWVQPGLVCRQSSPAILRDQWEGDAR